MTVADDRRASEHSPKAIPDELWANEPLDSTFEAALAIPDDEFEELVDAVDELAGRPTDRHSS